MRTDRTSWATRAMAVLAAVAVVLIMHLALAGPANAESPSVGSTVSSQSDTPDGGKPYEPGTAVRRPGGGPVVPGGEVHWDPKYTNNKCQSYYADSDCFHYAGTFTSHQGCVNKMGKILHVDPSSPSGKRDIFYGSLWNCTARPPTGHLDLYVYQSSPPCAVGKPYAQCPKG